MSRDDLIATNAGIVKTVTENVMKHSPDAILVIVSNPLDVMTYCAYLTAKSTASVYLAWRASSTRALPCLPRRGIERESQGHPSGAHGWPRRHHGATSSLHHRGGIPVTELINEDKLNAIVERTKKGGGEIVNLLGTSAWYALCAAAAQMVEALS